MRTEFKLTEISPYKLAEHEEGKQNIYNWRHKINLYTKRFFSVKFYINSNNEVFVSYKINEIYHFSRFSIKNNLSDNIEFCKVTIDSEGYVYKEFLKNTLSTTNITIRSEI